MSVDPRPLRAEIAALHDVKQHRRYDAELRGRIAAHARERLARGESVRAISMSLDVSPQVLTRSLSRSTALVPVRMAPEETNPRSPLVVRAPHGVTVEGATLDEVAALIVRLSRCSG